MDVGVDSHDFKPWHFDEIHIGMNTKAEAKALHLKDKIVPAGLPPPI